MRKYWITIALFFTSIPILAQEDFQNLVYNPSFEEHIECPHHIDALGTLTIVDGWYQPTSGSADYYNKCGSKECGIPNNKLGVQEAHSGNAYCGIYCSKTDYREYLQTQLKKPLIKGNTYRVTFYASLSEYSPHIIATLGALFTQERITDTTFSILMQKEKRSVSGQIKQTIATPYQPQVVHDFDSLINDMESWTKITGDFIANGDEQFLTIGNFYPASQSNFIDRQNPELILPGAYYYIDDVSVICINCNSNDTTNTNNDTINNKIIDEPKYAIGNSIILENIFFEFDKSTLLQQSYNELIKLYNLLQQYPKMKIEISGHTDNKGSAEYNLRLSEKRAQAVVNYLISKGIDEKRLQYKGYGKSHPISSNNTDTGRAKNRRVE